MDKWAGKTVSWGSHNSTTGNGRLFNVGGRDANLPQYGGSGGWGGAAGPAKINSSFMLMPCGCRC